MYRALQVVMAGTNTCGLPCFHMFFVASYALRISALCLCFMLRRVMSAVSVVFRAIQYLPLRLPHTDPKVRKNCSVWLLSYVKPHDALTWVSPIKGNCTLRYPAVKQTRLVSSCVFAGRCMNVEQGVAELRRMYAQHSRCTVASPRQIKDK